MALAKAGRLQEALPQLREALRLDPGYVPALNNLGVVLAQLGKEQEATELLRRSLQLQPSQAEAHYNLGRIFVMREAELGEAAKMFQRSIEFRRNFPDAYANLAAAWNGLGRHADTVNLLEGASAVVRDQPQAHFNLGAAYLLLGNRQAAEREVLVLRRLSPEMAGDLERRIARGAPGRR
jgi:Flp pilus assembly protein TadD